MEFVAIILWESDARFDVMWELKCMEPKRKMNLFLPNLELTYG
jgi:hypothetical protein